MRLLKQSSTAQKLLFLMVSSTDHVTAVTGLSPTVTLSKAGAAFGSPAGAVTELANGWYVVAGNATDTNTLGALILHATGTGADPTDIYYDVVAFDPQVATNLGLSALPTANPGAASGVLIAGSNAATTFATITSTGTLTIDGVSSFDLIADELNSMITAPGGNPAFTASAMRLAADGSAPIPTAAQIATVVWQDATAGDFTTASSIGKALYVSNVAPGGTGGHFIAGANAATSITTALTANITGNITGDLSGSVGSVTAAVSANDRNGDPLASLNTTKIVRIAKDGTATYYTPGGSADTDRGTALRSAVTAAAAFDRIIIPLGTFHIGTNVLVLPANCTLKGQGCGNTIIQSTADMGTVGAIVQCADYPTIVDLRIYGSLTNSTYQACLGGVFAGGAQSGFVGGVFERLWIDAGTDGMFISGATSAVFSGRFVDCVFRCKWDAIAIVNNDDDFPLTSATFDFIRCDLKTTGQHPAGVNNSECFYLGNSTIRCFDCTIESVNSLGGTSAAGVNVIGFDGQTAGNLAFTMFGGSIKTSGAVTNRDISHDAASTNIIAIGSDVKFDRTKVSGTITLFGAVKPTTEGRTLDVTATGAAGVDWANVEAPTTVQGLSGTTIKTATDIATYIDTEVAAIKAKTDQLTFTTPNVVDATGGGGGGDAMEATSAKILKVVQAQQD
jgi:hypothetical protein